MSGPGGGRAASGRAGRAPDSPPSPSNARGRNFRTRLPPGKTRPASPDFKAPSLQGHGTPARRARATPIQGSKASPFKALEATLPSRPLKRSPLKVRGSPSPAGAAYAASSGRALKLPPSKARSLSPQRAQGIFRRGFKALVRGGFQGLLRAGGGARWLGLPRLPARAPLPSEQPVKPQGTSPAGYPEALPSQAAPEASPGQGAQVPRKAHAPKGAARAVAVGSGRPFARGKRVLPSRAEPEGIRSCGRRAPARRAGVVCNTYPLSDAALRSPNNPRERPGFCEAPRTKTLKPWGE